MPPTPEGGSKRMAITEDLTAATHRKFKDLLEDERVEKVWTIDGCIWFVSKATKVARRIKSVYDTNDAIIG